jgi:NhaP-type Na+/H+ or K+/H+ antiporter
MFITILTIGILVFVAHLFTALFERTRIPDVLLLMLLGIIAGPILHLVEPSDFGKAGLAITTIALIAILFEGGTALNIPVIARAAASMLSLTLVTFIVTVTIATIFFVFVFHATFLTGLIFGCIIGGTSSAVVVPMVRGLKLKEPAGTILVLESSLTDVLCIVLAYALLEATIRAEASVGKIIGTILSALFFAAVVGIIGGHLWLFILNRVRRFPNTIFTTFAFIFILYGFSEMLGYSGAITALSFGITLTNFQFLHFNRLPFLRSVQWQSLYETDRLFFSEIVFLLKVFFFLFLGISIRLDNLLLIFLGFLLVLAIYIARLIITRFVLTKTVDRFDASVVSVMVPKGLAAAVLATLPTQYGIQESAIIQDIVYIVIFISIFLTAVMIPLLDKVNIYKSLFRAFTRVKATENANNKVLI